MVVLVSKAKIKNICQNRSSGSRVILTQKSGQKSGCIICAKKPKNMISTGGGRSMVQKRGLSMVQKRGVSMVQLSDLRQLFFGKGVSRWYNEIFKKKIFCVYESYNMTGFLRGNNFVQKLGARGCTVSA